MIFENVERFLCLVTNHTMKSDVKISRFPLMPPSIGMWIPFEKGWYPHSHAR